MSFVIVYFPFFLVSSYSLQILDFSSFGCRTEAEGGGWWRRAFVSDRQGGRGVDRDGNGQTRDETGWRTEAGRWVVARINEGFGGFGGFGYTRERERKR